MTYDAEELLTQWGRWSRQQVGMPRCTSPSYVLMRDNVEQIGGLPAADITDDEAVLVDRIIARMSQRYPKTAECVVIFYRSDRTLAEVGRIVGEPRLKVREYLIAAKGYVEAYMEMGVAA
ncbi:hypothetical protein PHLH3_08550 [Pseudomonas sp. St386]|uniref:antiterminator Q family protein n=1 Tax=Pseudomonas sp. St386 TaxID=2678256 RepID=UPI001BB30240|nr:antiterminator Q family protein [Pseudomonas sp. St386]BBP51229.1 hypothetical protein PHLH3_08550 [Pseudomonas sp. St386]